MHVSKRFWLCCAGILALSAQTPAAPAVTPPPKPLRRLTYSFSVDYLTNGEGHDSGMSIGGEGGSGSGVDSMLGGGGRRGTMYVDVNGLSPDGALIVAVNESLEHEPRPQERFTCTVYGDGHVLCPNADGPLSDAENLLLSMLGRGFIDASVSPTNQRWRRTYQGKEVSVVTDYALKDPGNGAPVTILKHSTVKSYVRTIGDSVEDGTIVYDRALSVPDTVNDTVYETRANGSLQTTFSFRLISDSFASH